MYRGRGCSHKHYYANSATTHILQRGNKANELTFLFPAALDVILKTDGRNEQSDCGISWLSVSESPKAHKELERD